MISNKLLQTFERIEGISYIYGLVDERELDHYRYIGKAVDCDKRLKEHINDSLLYNETDKEKWIFSVLLEGSNVSMVVFEAIDCPNDDKKIWGPRERIHIKFRKRQGHQLTNNKGCPGGEGWTSGDDNPSKDPKNRKAQSERMKGRFVGDDNWMHVNRHLLTGEGNFNWNKRWSDELRASRSGENSHMFGKTGELSHAWGRVLSQEQIEVLRIANIGKRASDETKEKMALCKIGVANHRFGKTEYTEKELEDLGNGKRKGVTQFDLITGEEIKQFISIAAVYKELKICNISDVCLGKAKHAGGFGWKYTDEQKEFVINQIDYKTNEIVGTFKVLQKAAEAVGLKNAVAITCVLNGQGYTAGGYKWEKVDIETKTFKKFVNRRNITPVNQIDIKTGEIINNFESYHKAGISIGLKDGDKISYCCRGKLEEVGGFKWEKAV